MTSLDDTVHRAVLDADVHAGPDEVEAVVRAHAPLLDDAAVAEVSRRVRARMHGLGLLDELLADDEVTDVLVNGPGRVWTESGGELRATAVVLDAAEVRQLVERVVTPLGLRADRRSPLVDARLPDGSRVHIALPPLAVDGPYVTVRRFAARTLPVAAFASAPVAERLVRAVSDRRSIVVSGGTGAGKTTLLNALCQHLRPGERVVTIEDAAELRLPGDHVVRLESRPATADGLEAVTIRELVRNALRMRPDRIVVGEVRGPEALDMVQAMNTGHDGSLSTCHANGPIHALRRLETMVLTAGVDLPLVAVRDQLATAVDLVVHVSRGHDADPSAGRSRPPRGRGDLVIDPTAAVAGLVVVAGAWACGCSARWVAAERTLARTGTAPPRRPAPAVVERAVARAGLEVDPRVALQLWVATVAVSAAAAAVVGGGVVLLVVSVVAPPGVLALAGGRASRLRVRQLPLALDTVAASVRGGASLRIALADAAALGGPLGAELDRIASRAAAGQPLAEAVGDWADDADDAPSRLAAASLAVAAELGGPGADAVADAASSLREGLAADDEVAALSVQARLSALLLTLAPVVFAALLTSFDPTSARFLFQTPTGWACISAGLALDAVGAWWMSRLVRRAR